MRASPSPSYVDLFDRIHYLKKETDIQEIMGFFNYLNRFRSNFHLFRDHIFYVIDYTRRTHILMTGAVVQVSGYQPGDFLNGGVDFIIDIFHKDDFKIWNSEVFTSILGFLAQQPHEDHQSFVFDVTYRMRNKSGKTFTAMQKGSYITDPKTLLPLYSYGVAFDISHLKNDTSMLRLISRYDDHNDEYHPLATDYYYPDPELSQLTRREKEILSWMADGYSTKQIADKFRLSGHTVVNHRKNMMRKTNCKNTAELIAFAIRRRII
jgi:DNA-binding CsgD family transcriptional regulator